VQESKEGMQCIRRRDLKRSIPPVRDEEQKKSLGEGGGTLSHTRIIACSWGRGRGPCGIHNSVAMRKKRTKRFRAGRKETKIQEVDEIMREVGEKVPYYKNGK